MTNDDNLKPASKAEFDKFIDEYPRVLIYHCNAIYEPPVCTYNDFTLGEYPESIVACHAMFTSYDDPTPNKFYIWDGDK